MYFCASINIPRDVIVTGAVQGLLLPTLLPRLQGQIFQSAARCRMTISVPFLELREYPVIVLERSPVHIRARSN